MIGSPTPAGAPADHTHWCPGGCQTRVANRLFACGDCWVRLPFQYQQPISATYRRDLAAHGQAMGAARRWYQDNQLPADTQPAPPNTLTETLQDIADMLAGIGRHNGHTREQAGRCTVCSCGLRVQGRPT